MSRKYFGLLCVSVDLHFRCHGASSSSTDNATSFLVHFMLVVVAFVAVVGVRSPQCNSVVCFAGNSIASGDAEKSLPYKLNNFIGLVQRISWL